MMKKHEPPAGYFYDDEGVLRRIRTDPLTEEERHKILTLYTDLKDNRVSVIAEKTGLSWSRVNDAISKYLDEVKGHMKK
jgi:hypothetical protein